MDPGMYPCKLGLGQNLYDWSGYSDNPGKFVLLVNNV